MSRPLLDQIDARNVAIIKPSALGDIIHALPVLTALRRRFPQSRITWVVNRLYEPLLQGHPDLDATLAFDRSAGPVRGAWQFVNLLRTLRNRRFDLVIDLQGLLRSGLMTGATCAPRRVGLSDAREGARWFYSDVVSVPNAHELHAVDRYWHVVEALGLPADKKSFHVPIKERDRRIMLESIGDCPRPWIMVGVGARWPTKRWPAEHFGSLLCLAQDRFGGTVFFVGSKDDEQLARRAVVNLRGRVRLLTGRTTLLELAAVLSLADVMVANDTGPLHLAAALGRPVVAPYTCTQARLTGPYGQLDRAIETTVWCRGSLCRKCDRLECMSELTPARLWPVLCDVLLTWQNQNKSIA